MTDYTELVKALRCGEYRPECGSSDCPYWSGLGCMDGQLVEDAAAAIEELQQIADHYEQTAKDYWKEACEYKAQLPKQGEWVDDEETYDSFEFLRACDREFTRGDGSIADWASNYYLLEAESYSESVIKLFDTFELAMRSYSEWRKRK